MRLLAFLCSPRREGNTALLLKELIRGAKEGGAETESINPCRLRIAPCSGCGACEKTGRCAIKDQMQAVYDQIDTADIITLASPIYFYNVTAQCKTLIDRCQAMWSRKYVLRRTARSKSGFFLSVGATKGKKMFDCAVLTVRYFFDAINATDSGHLLFSGIDKKGDIRDHPTALKEAYETGKRLVRSPQKLETTECGSSR
jgi:multimeric flavodoxin WrbA